MSFLIFSLGYTVYHIIHIMIQPSNTDSFSSLIFFFLFSHILHFSPRIKYLRILSESYQKIGMGSSYCLRFDNIQGNIWSVVLTYPITQPETFLNSTCLSCNQVEYHLCPVEHTILSTFSTVIPMIPSNPINQPMGPLPFFFQRAITLPVSHLHHQKSGIMNFL